MENKPENPYLRQLEDEEAKPVRHKFNPDQRDRITVYRNILDWTLIIN